MKILIATGIFPPDVGGPATYSRTLATEFTKLGHEVRVITYADPDRKFQISNFKFQTVRILRTRFKLWNYFRFFRAVKKYGRDADVIYAQGPVSDGYPAYLASRILKKPFVVKITGDYSWEQAMSRALTDKLIDEFQTLPDYPSRISRMRDIQKTVCAHAQIVVTPSEYLKKIVIGWGVKPEKIKVVYNAVEKPAVSSQQSAVRKKYGIKEGTFLIISSGRDVPWKGFELLKKVVSELKSEHPEMELKVLHNSPRAEFHEYVRAADLYVLNTGYEGLSNTLVEVLHLGTPIITTNVGGNPEIIKSEDNGLLVEYNNTEQLKTAILRIYTDAGLRNKLRNNALASLSQFALEKMISKTMEVLKSCVS